jgi:hypothetical protein
VRVWECTRGFAHLRIGGVDLYPESRRFVDIGLGSKLRIIWPI